MSRQRGRDRVQSLRVIALARLERGDVDPRMSTLMAVHRALSEAGMEFPGADVKGEGVWLADPKA